VLNEGWILSSRLVPFCAAWEAVEPELYEEAEECQAAKDRLVGAETDEEVARALQIIEVLCDG